LNYIENKSKIHFWGTIIGVNLTFFPMHFLGLNGMPRRVPDFPDVFQYWNSIASYSSIFTFFITLFFIQLIINSFFNNYFWFNLFRNTMLADLVTIIGTVYTLFKKKWIE